MRLRQIEPGKTYVNYRGDRKREVLEIVGDTVRVKELALQGHPETTMSLRTFAAWALEVSQ